MTANFRVREIERADAPTVAALSALLTDAVVDGASVGYLLPVSPPLIEAYWAEVLADVGRGERLLLALDDGDVLVGSAQLALCMKPNGRHRAEVQKVLVHTSQRGRGGGRALMIAVEAIARQHARTLLVLDTESGSAGQHLYEAMGYLAIGAIPNYAIGTVSGWVPSTFMYKLLPTDHVA